MQELAAAAGADCVLLELRALLHLASHMLASQPVATPITEDLTRTLLRMAELLPQVGSDVHDGTSAGSVQSIRLLQERLGQRVQACHDSLVQSQLAAAEQVRLSGTGCQGV